MESNKLIKYDDRLVKRVDNSISITKKLLSSHLNDTAESTLKNKMLAMQKLKKLVNEARAWHEQRDGIGHRGLNNETNQELPFENGK